MNHCLNCRTELTPGEVNCEACGELLGGSRMVAEENLQEEAAVAYGLLREAGLHPAMAYLDEGGEPRLINPDLGSVPGAGLMPPVTTPFAVFVPEDEAEEAAKLLADAGRDPDEGEPTAG